MDTLTIIKLSTLPTKKVKIASRRHTSTQTTPQGLKCQSSFDIRDLDPTLPDLDSIVPLEQSDYGKIKSGVIS
jgi:hypothetical protein